MSKIEIVLEGVSVREFMNEITESNVSTRAFSKIQRAETDKRGLSISPEAGTIIVTGINSLILLINSILVFLSKRKTGTIRIIGSSGRTIEVPKDTPPDKIEYYLDAAKRLDAERIIVSSTNLYQDSDEGIRSKPR